MASADASHPLSEAAVIERLALGAGAGAAGGRADVQLGIGDDGAVLEPPPGCDLVTVVDTLVEGVHFPAGTQADDLGFKSLAVNLSDLAAMGAEPAWATVALCLMAPDADWVDAFARGFFELALEHNVALVGGDTVRGLLTVTVQVTGFVPSRKALTRAGARAGDDLYVSGTPGDAAAGLGTLTGKPALPASIAGHLVQRFLRPTPRVQLGVALRAVASAAIDISDGLVVDAARLAAASGLRADLSVESLPMSDALVDAVGLDDARQCALSGGDDYELLFAIPPGQAAQLAAIARQAGCALTRIGRLEAGEGVQCRLGGQPFVPRAGFDHFPGTG